MNAISVRLDPIEFGLYQAGGGRCDKNPTAAIIGYHRVRYRKIARSTRSELDPVAGVIADDAVGHCQGISVVEPDPGRSAADPLDREAAQVDVSGDSGIDLDAGSVSGNDDAGHPAAVVHDADRFRDRHRAITT